MKKKKLSTISLNAATLDSQQPDYYNFRGYGLGTQTNDVLPHVTDYNVDMPTGFYTGAASGTSNAPSTSRSYTLLHIKRGIGFSYQLAFAVTLDEGVFYRSSVNNIWSAWRKITMA